PQEQDDLLGPLLGRAAGVLTMAAQADSREIPHQHQDGPTQYGDFRRLEKIRAGRMKLFTDHQCLQIHRAEEEEIEQHEDGEQKKAAIQGIHGQERQRAQQKQHDGVERTSHFDVVQRSTCQPRQQRADVQSHENRRAMSSDPLVLGPAFCHKSGTLLAYASGPPILGGFCYATVLSWTLIPPYGHGGLVVAALAVIGAVLLPRLRESSASRRPVYVLTAMALLPALAELVLTTWYLFSPTYLDHIEASTASDAHYFRQGIALYPDLDAYTFHGLVYGPLLAELNSLGYLFASGVLASKLIGWIAAWLAMAMLVAMPAPAAVPGQVAGPVQAASPVSVAAGRRWPWVVATALTLCILASFGSVLTADRADSLLILCAISGFFAVLYRPTLLALAVAAASAGAAADLKLHGPIYLVPAL